MIARATLVRMVIHSTRNEFESARATAPRERLKTDNATSEQPNTIPSRSGPGRRIRQSSIRPRCGFGPSSSSSADGVCRIASSTPCAAR